MSEACREMNNIEIANQIWRDLLAAEAFGAGAWKIKIIDALNIKDARIKHLEEKQEALYKKCCEYEQRLEL